MFINISIIVPVFNDEEGIKDTLNSIKSECDKELEKVKLEVIVVDNNSNDKTYEIAKSYNNDYIRVYKQDKIQGSYASRNFGVKKSKGHFLLFIDSDMIFEKNHFKRILLKIKNDNVKYAGFNVKMKLTKQSLSGKMNYLKGFDIKNSIIKHHYTPTCALLISRDVFNSTGGFEDNLESGGDFVFGQKVRSLKYNQTYLKDIIIYHPTRNNYLSLIKKSNRVARGNAQLALLNPKKYNYLYKRHFKLKNFKIRNPFSYSKAFAKNQIEFSFFEFLLSPFFYIPISILRAFHVKSYYKKLLK
tara:strand:- start:14109 stop:15011 length:903 start_codon:yes stop_codon:yes gene_type:complete